MNAHRLVWVALFHGFLAQAGTPLWTFAPLTSTTVTTSVGNTVTVSYTVTNQSSRTHILSLQSIDGVTQDTGGGNCASPMTLTGKASCTLALQITSTTARTIRGGPILCQQNNNNLCYQPSSANSLNVTFSSAYYTLGGTVSGASGEVVLQNNGGDSLTTSNGSFTFATSLISGSTYSVTVQSSPSGQTCTVSQGTGTITGNTTSVAVTCSSSIKKIFVTSSTYSPAFGGSASAAITAADAACMADSNKPSGGGTYKAMIANSARRACSSTTCVNSGASENLDWVLAPSSTYYRADGTTEIGTTNSAGVFSFPVTNDFSTGHNYVMTGLESDWTTSSNNCTNWTSSNSSQSYNRGYEGVNTSTTIEAGSPTDTCDNSARLYCVSQ